MGVAAGLLWVAGLLLAGGLGTHWLEKRFLRPEEEAGAAGPVQTRIDIVPLDGDRWLYPAGPVLSLLAVAWAAIVLPFSPALVGEDLGIGVFYFIVVVDYVVLGLALGGWGAGTRHSVEVYYRATAQLVSYVVPLGLALMGPIMMSRSLSTVAIVEAQGDFWFVLVQPQGFALYLVCALMQSYRRPFLEPFSPEIDHGVLSVYGGWKAVLWRLSLSGLLFVVAAMGAVLFLGGWRGPWLPAPVWMAVKTTGLLLALLWLGRRLPLRSTAQMLRLAWRVLIPAGLVNVLIVGLTILLGVGG